MNDSLPIDEVARRTGLTSRALRFYEARGLIAPLRTALGRRWFDPAQLERLHQIVALKRAGFSLAAIGKLLSERRTPVGNLIRIQLDALEQQRAEIETSAELLRQALSRVEGGEPLDGATLCSLIHESTRIMTETEKWGAVNGPYATDASRADFAASAYPEGFNQAEYSAKWKSLGDRIKAALPLDPASQAAQAFVAEWQELLAPFTAIATPAMMESVKAMYDDMPNWGEGAPSPGFDHDVWNFIKAAGAARQG